MGPSPARRVTAAVAVVLMLSACAPGAGPTGSDMAASTDVGGTTATGGSADTGAPDSGAAAREAALARYADEAGGDAEPPATTTPDIVGRSEVAAEQLLEGAGLALRVVPYDRTEPITEQWPAAGQPVPLDQTIEGWLGSPPEPEATPTERVDAPPDHGGGAPAAVSSTPAPASTATESEPEPTTGGQQLAAADTAPARYVLPPHTEGRLRTNPSRLPALPLGTELTGTASWYGPGFQGLTTACGGVYDMNGPTLAARELRCGTVVRITGPTGATVEATVTDWGPAEWTGRRFDLSAAVFNAIAPLGTGVIDVRVVTANVPG